MHERRRVAFLIFTMTLVVFGVATIVFYILYQAAFAQQRDRLRESVDSQAHLIEAIGLADQQEYGATHTPEETFTYTLNQIKAAQVGFRGFGKTGEFTLSQRQGDLIVFLLAHRHYDLEHPLPVPFDSTLAEPARRALLGQSGTVVGLDYRGSTVLAAYEPVGIYGLGLVAKIDVSEIRAPFIRAGEFAAGTALALILFGTLLFLRITNPLMRQLEENEARYRAVFEQAADAIVLINPYTGGIVEFNASAYENLGYSREEFRQLKLSDLTIGESPSALAARIQNTIKEGHANFEAQRRTKNGEMRQIAISSRAIVFQGKKYLLSIWHDITERNRMEKTLRESEARFRALYSSMTELFVLHEMVYDESGQAIDYRILDCNPAFSLSTGIPCERAMNALASQVYGTGEAPYLERYAHVAESGEPVEFETYYPPLDRYFNISVFSPGKGSFATVAADITDRKRMEEMLYDELKINVTLATLYKPLVSPLSSLEKIAHIVLDQSRQITGSEHGYVSVIDPISGDNVGYTLTEMFKDQCKIGGDENRRIVFPCGADGRYPGLWGYCLNTREAFFTNSPQVHPASKGIPDGHISLERFLSVPVLIGERVVGQIALAHPIRDYTGYDLDAVSRVGEFYALAIQRMRIEDAVRQQNEYLLALQETTLELVSQLDLGHLLENIVRRAGQLVGTTAGFLDLLDLDTHQLLPKVGLGALAESLKFSVQPGEGLSGTIWQTRQPLVINDYDAWSGRISGFSPHTLRSIMGVPLLAGDQIVGVLGVAFDHESPSSARQTFGPEAVDLLTQFARLAVIAIDNARLFAIIERELTERIQAEESERDQRTLSEALRGTAEILTGTLNLDEVLDRILAYVGKVVPHDAASITLIENGVTHNVRTRGYEARGLEEWTRKVQFTVAETPTLRKMFETGLPVVVPDTAQDPAWLAIPETRWIHSFAGAPIRVEGQVLGFLILDSSAPGFFTQEHALRLQAFADQAALAIKNARLYDEIHRHADILDLRVKKRTAQLNQAKERVEAILNSSSDIILVLSSEGLIQQVNPIFNETFECSTEESLGQPFTILAVPDCVAPLQDALRAAVDTRRPQRLEIDVAYRDCTMFNADVALSPIVPRDGPVLSVVCSLRDITMSKQTEASLRRMLDRETELSDMKTRFISTASHEFRTPLAIIQSASEILEHYGHKMPDERKQKEYQQIRTSIADIVGLLDDVLTINQAQRGKLEFHPVPLDLEALCHEILADFERTTGKEHALVFTHTGSNSSVSMDPKLLRHILGNLLSNACKYSPAGSTVTLDLSYQNNQAILRVHDEGIGIPAGDQAKLFEPFHRAQNVGTVHGNGLGLAIVKQAVDLHGGTIEVESVEGQGTAFTVILPDVSS